ncbi:hypothetical protein ABMB44_14775 [Levilactobacillus brevis]
MTTVILAEKPSQARSYVRSQSHQPVSTLFEATIDRATTRIAP